MNTHDVTREMSKLPRIAFNQSGPLFSAGVALAVIGDLLGADGSEYNLSEEQLEGLQHGVVVIGLFLKGASISLAGAAEAAGALID